MAVHRQVSYQGDESDRVVVCGGARVRYRDLSANVSGVLSQSVIKANQPSLLENLEAWYRNDETDRSGNGRDLYYLSDPNTKVAGPDGGAASATETIPTSGLTGSSLPTPGSYFTFATFVRYPDPDFITGGEAVSCMNQVDTGVTYDPLNELFYFTIANNYATFPVPGGKNTRWHHVCLVRDGSTYRAYYDGALVKSGAAAGASAGGDFQWGNVIDYGPPAVCQTHNCGVWSRALAAAEVAALYNGGAGFDPTA